MNEKKLILNEEGGSLTAFFIFGVARILSHITVRKL